MTKQWSEVEKQVIDCEFVKEHNVQYHQKGSRNHLLGRTAKVKTNKYPKQ